MPKTLSQRQAISILVLFILGTTMISGVAKTAKENAWITVLTAGIICVPIYLIYAQLMQTFRNKNIFEICEVVYGKAIGKFLSLIFIFNAIYISAILIRKASEFMDVAGLDATPLLLIMPLFTLVSIYFIKKGLYVFGKWCQFYFMLVIGVIIFEAIFLIPIRNLDYLQPVLYDGISPVIHGTIYTLGFPLVQIGHLLSLFNVLDEKASYRKVYLYGLLISIVALLVITVDNITVLGGESYSRAYFPSYLTYRRFEIGQFFKRIEILSILTFLVVVFVKLTAALFNAVIGLKALFNLKTYKNLAVPVVFLCSILGYLAYEDTIEMEKVINDAYIYFSIIVNALLPIFIYVTYLIKSFILSKMKLKSST